MRLRRVTLTTGGTSVAVWDAPRERWVPLAAAAPLAGGAPPELQAVADDPIALLADPGLRAEAERLAAEVADHDLDTAFSLSPALLPFAPRSLRAFAGWQEHWEQAARTLVGRYFPRVRPVMRAYERVTRTTFPPLRPGPLFFERPCFYVGTHTTFLPDGAELPWPAFCRDLDYELELACVLAHPVRDCTPDEGAAAIGGFVVMNDCSARDVQWEEARRGLFGPLGKTKSFANAMGPELVSADEILPRVGALRGTVRVNGETWSETSTAGMQHTFGELVAEAARGEQLLPGEMLSSGTLPRGCGMELDRWIQPGDALELEIEGVGMLRGTVGARGVTG